MESCHVAMNLKIAKMLLWNLPWNSRMCHETCHETCHEKWQDICFFLIHRNFRSNYVAMKLAMSNQSWNFKFFKLIEHTWDCHESKRTYFIMFFLLQKNATYLLLKFSWQLERQDICYLNLPRNFEKSKIFALQFWRISNFWRYWELPRKFDWQMKMARYLLFWSCNQAYFFVFYRGGIFHIFNSNNTHKCMIEMAVSDFNYTK